MSVLVECYNLTKCYSGGAPAVDDLNLTIESGHIIGLLGPNGSGKTTIIKMINGLLKPTKGTVLVEGLKPDSISKSIVSYLPERTYLEAGKTVGDLISFFETFYSDFRPERARAMLESLKINEKARLKTLSKGTKEKVQLIMTMSRRAKVYLLDEPIAGVDPAARDYILRTIIGNYSENALVLISTHLIADVEPVLDEVIFLKQGHIELHENTDALRERTGMSVDNYFREVYRC